MRVKIGRMVLQVNLCQYAESDFGFDITLSRWRPWRYLTLKTAAAQHKVSARSLCSSFQQFVIY